MCSESRSCDPIEEAAGLSQPARPDVLNRWTEDEALPKRHLPHSPQLRSQLYNSPQPEKRGTNKQTTLH